MKEKKNEPLSAFGKRGVRVMDQGLPAAPATNITIPTRVASPATSVEEIMPLRKKAQVDKGKEKASSRSSNVWYDANLTQTMVQEVFSTNELKELSRVPPNKIVGRHVHKLVQVIYSSSLSLVFFFFFGRLDLPFRF